MAETPSKLVEFLNQQMEERHWSKADFARAAGLGRSTITETFGGKRPGMDVCKAIAKALEMPPEVIFDLAGHIKQHGNLTPEEAEWLSLFRGMDAEARGDKLAEMRLAVELRKKRSKHVGKAAAHS